MAAEKEIQPMKWGLAIPRSLALLLWAATAWAQPSGAGTATVIERAVLAASCSLTHVQAAITAATAGDTILVPAGTCTWGTSSAALNVNKAVTIRGAGQGVTIIQIASTAGTWTDATIQLNAAATVRGFTIQTVTSGNSGTAFSAAVDGFRVTDIAYVNQASTTTGYFMFTTAYGVIDNNSITGGGGSNELIFAKGPTDSWQTAHSIGGADNLFVENNLFAGQGYLTDCNANSRCVVRYNTTTGPMKVDGHGKATNSPARSVRHMEVYNNLWTSAYTFWATIEMRGGGGRVFDNVSINTTSARFYLTDYGATTAAGNFGGVCQCPSDYPIDDQIGVGIDPKTAAAEPMYLWGNTMNGSPWPLTNKATTACTATCGGAFPITDIVQENRDFFKSTTKPAAMSGYTIYTCPHPMVGAGTCGTGAGRTAYVVN
jgi:hypothetical protein